MNNRMKKLEEYKKKWENFWKNEKKSEKIRKSEKKILIHNNLILKDMNIINGKQTINVVSHLDNLVELRFISQETSGAHDIRRD